jgi:metal-responsive CopG/Arc/MetJ family transcriptional regulator
VESTGFEGDRMKTIQMTIDEPLLARLDQAAAADHVARSALIRVAVERELERIEIQEKIRRHQEAYARMPQSGDDLDWPVDPEMWDNL